MVMSPYDMCENFSEGMKISRQTNTYVYKQLSDDKEYCLLDWLIFLIDNTSYRSLNTDRLGSDFN